MTAFAFSGLLAGISSLVFGVFVFLSTKNRRLGLIWFLFSLSVAAWEFGALWIGTTKNISTSTLAWHCAYGFGVVWITALFYHFVCEFLDESRRWVWMHYTIVAIFLTILPSHYFFSRFVWSFGQFYWAISGLAFPCFFVWWLGLMLYAHWRLICAYPKVSTVKKAQITYFFLAIGVAFFGGSLSYLPSFGVTVYPWGNFTVWLYPYVMAYAIVAHQLMDIDVIIKRTLIYSIVSACLIAIYVSVVTSITRMLAGRVMSPSAYSSAIAAGIIALLFDPLRTRIQRFVDRRFARERVDREQQLIRFSNDISHQRNILEMSETLRQTLVDLFNPKWLCLYVRKSSSPDFHQIAANPTARFPDVLEGDHPWVTLLHSQMAPILVSDAMPGIRAEFEPAKVEVIIPVANQREWMGLILLGPKESERGFDTEDLGLLRIIMNQASLTFERPRLVDELSGAFIHEVKTPLTGITLSAELSVMDLEAGLRTGQTLEELGEKLKKRLNMIITKARLAGVRLDAVREMSNAKSTKPETVNVAQAIQNVLSQMADLLDKTGISAETDLPTTALPAIYGHEQQLEILFANLFKNAAEAMAESQTRTLWVRVRQQAVRIVIEVEDTGPGIPKTSQKLAFQSHYSTKGSKGTGMGLFLAQQIVTAHGGAITVQEAPTGGALFRIVFPISKDSPKD